MLCRRSVHFVQALEEKQKGNVAYKKKDFETALACYDRAIELDPEDITFLTNKAGKGGRREGGGEHSLVSSEWVDCAIL